MTPRIVFRPEARAEVRAAQSWYEERIAGLGIRFARAVDATLTTIALHPEGFPTVHGEARQCVMRRFPYSVIYRVTGSEIVVLAVQHQRRAPEAWRGRTV